MKTEFKYISADLQQSWDGLTGKNPSSGFMQSFFWADFKKKCGWKTYKIGLFTVPAPIPAPAPTAVGGSVLVGGAIVMKCPSSAQTNFLYIPEGPVLDYGGPHIQKNFDSLMMEINKIADRGPKQFTTHLRIDPLLVPTPGCASNPLLKNFIKSPGEFQPAHTLMLGLESCEKDLLLQMKPKGRYNIKIAEQHGIEVKEHSLKEGFPVFYSLYKKTTGRHNFEGLSEGYFTKLINTDSAAGHLKIFVAEHNGEPLSAAIIVFFGGRATYFFGASSDTHKELMAPYKLHWEIIRRAKTLGYGRYDFWGIAPDVNDRSHPWYGLSQFKLKSGGRPMHFPGAHDFVYQEDLYQKYLVESGQI